MKRFLTLSLFLLALAVVGSDLFAYGSRRSLSWVRTMNRYATTKSIDATQFNPAGTTKMKDGIYVHLDNQMAYKTYSSQLSSISSTSSGLPMHGTESVDETPVWLNPSVALMYKKGKVSVFGNFDVPAGGGSVEYRQSGIDCAKGLSFAGGQPVSKFVGDSSTLAFSLGIAYSPWEWLSLSAGFRYLNGTGSVTAGVGTYTILDMSYKQDGYTGFVGVNITPIKQLNIGITYQPEVRLRGKMSIARDVTGVLTGGGTVWGADSATYLGYYVSSLGVTYGGVGEEAIDGKLYTGIAYEIIEGLEVQLGFTYGFEKQQKYVANALNMPLTSTALSALSSSEQLLEYNKYFINKKKRDGYSIGGGVEYKIGMFTPSVGVMYDKSADTPSSNRSSPWDPGLNAWFVSAGLVIAPTEMVDIELAVLKAFYEKTESIVSNGSLTFKKDVWVYGFGLTFKFLDK